MNIILGVLDANSSIIRNLEDIRQDSVHMKERDFRIKLSLSEAKPLYFYDVFRRKDRSRQVHCLYNDSSLVVYNKSNGKVVTVILLDSKGVEKYLKAAEDSLENHSILRMCSKIHNRLSQLDFSDEDEVEKFRERKLKYMKLNNG